MLSKIALLPGLRAISMRVNEAPCKFYMGTLGILWDAAFLHNECAAEIFAHVLIGQLQDIVCRSPDHDRKIELSMFSSAKPLTAAHLNAWHKIEKTSIIKYSYALLHSLCVLRVGVVKYFI